MKKLFEEYGGVITTAIAIVALIGVVGLMFNPTGTGWMDSSFQGVIQGFNGKVDAAILNEGGTIEPIAYSYNGVELPALPEWDKEVYPYAVLRSDPFLGHVLTVTDNSCVNEGSAVSSVVIRNSTFSQYYIPKNSDNWLLLREPTYDDDYVLGECCWSNYNILNTDGTVYLAASDPIPVHE
ncbi:MAG: hypothetical protein IKU94_10025 [Bacteroidaceae bacterium]|nr:hypothetical protein [Bacteroidaceae bacterium]